MNKILNLNGTLVELNKLSAIIINDEGYFDIKLKSNQIKFILKNRKEYIYNPSEQEYELIEITDDFIVEFPNSDEAVRNIILLKNIWEDAITV